MTPREYTEEEIREIFLKRVWMLVGYWREQYLSEGKTTSDCLEGLAFSILSQLDGGTLELPAFLIVPSPHEEDKEFSISMGQNYFPSITDDMCVKDLVDIGGSLHEEFYKYQ